MSLPSGYKRLEYIQSSGTQYIDSGVFVKSENLKIDLTFMYTASAGNSSLYGAETSGRNWPIVPYGMTSFYVGLSGPSLSVSTSINIKYNMIAHANNGALSVFLNGSISTASYSGTLCKTLSIFLFANNINGTAKQLVSARFYLLKIYDNDTLVRDFIPCQTTAGEIGLWDDVNSVFYGNAGTGTFTAGPEIIPDPPAAPAGLQTVLAVVLQWAASANTDRYDVYRDGSKLGSTEGTQYVDATPEANQTYVYTVKAVNGGGESAGTSITVYTKSGYFEYKPLIESANFP